MNSIHITRPERPERPEPARWRGRWWVLAALFAAALAARVRHITNPPLDFHANKQFRSAIIARHFYLQSRTDVPAWRKDVSRAQRELIGTLEPPLMEWLASRMYTVVGYEALWMPRLVSAICWLVGGVFLYGLARRLGGDRGAVVSVLLYLFLPYGILASRSFQADPPMIMLFLLALLQLLRLAEKPTWPRTLAAALAVAAALLIKPLAAVPLLGALAVLTLWRLGLRRALGDARTWCLVLIALAPAGIYYAMGAFGQGDMARQAGSKFNMLAMLRQPKVYLDWLGMALSVVGPTALLGAMMGSVLAPPGPTRPMLLGLWLGYVLHGFVFLYGIHTHDYYQLVLVPIVALALAPIGGAVADTRLRGAGRAMRLGVIGATLCAIALCVWLTPFDRGREHYRRIEVAPHIGEAVDHSTHTLFLAAHYGKLLYYYGELRGYQWPTRHDFYELKLRGIKPLTAAERIEKMKTDFGLEYFIITDLPALRRQPDLLEALELKYTLLMQTPDYRIYDIRHAPRDIGPASP